MLSVWRRSVSRRRCRRSSLFVLLNESCYRHHCLEAGCGLPPAASRGGSAPDVRGNIGILLGNIGRRKRDFGVIEVPEASVYAGDGEEQLVQTGEAERVGGAFWREDGECGEARGRGVEADDDLDEEGARTCTVRLSTLAAVMPYVSYGET